jgi:hypothetical protein
MACARASAHRVAIAAAAFGLEMTRLSALWRKLKRDFRDPYRPELHYMRGPGPKWRQRNVGIVPLDEGMPWIT